jgi:hypothetical protein
VVAVIGRASVTAEALIIPATLAPTLAEAMNLLREQRRNDHITLTDDEVDLDRVVRALADVIRQRHFRDRYRGSDGAACEVSAPQRQGLDTSDNGTRQSVSDAAISLGVTPRRVRQLLASGDLAGTRGRAHWWVDADSVRDLVRNRKGTK